MNKFLLFILLILAVTFTSSCKEGKGTNSSDSSFSSSEQISETYCENGECQFPEI